jgi:hypothetical protein
MWRDYNPWVNDSFIFLRDQWKTKFGHTSRVLDYSNMKKVMDLNMFKRNIGRFSVQIFGAEISDQEIINENKYIRKFNLFTVKHMRFSSSFKFLTLNRSIR